MSGINSKKDMHHFTLHEPHMLKYDQTTDWLEAKLTVAISSWHFKETYATDK